MAHRLTFRRVSEAAAVWLAAVAVTALAVTWLSTGTRYFRATSEAT